MRWYAGIVFVAIISAVYGPFVALASDDQVTTPVALPDFGQPRADLTPEERAAFYDGQRLFTQQLPAFGPLYNDVSCASCHSIPTIGGSGDIEHAAYVGPQPDGRIMLYRRHALSGWSIPSRTPLVSRRIPPPLYGLGLVERIPDETIRAACGEGHADRAKLQGSVPKN